MSCVCPKHATETDMRLSEVSPSFSPQDHVTEMDMSHSRVSAGFNQFNLRHFNTFLIPLRTQFNSDLTAQQCIGKLHLEEI